MGSALSSFSSLVGSVLSSCCSPSLLSLPPAPPPSPAPSQIKYDVFLSFKGEDTNYNFTSHLDKAFRDKGIYHFIDYQPRIGDEISPFLLQAIESSLISVVIFSENYADSRWRLEELVKILECKEMHGQIVMPIFYKIDPTHVRHQTGSYAAVFAKHKKRFKKDSDKVKRWKNALNEAANLSGLDSSVVKPESALVEKIVEDVVKRLNNMPSSDNKKLVGIESKIAEIEAMLGMGDQMNNGVRKVGIFGIGGIGKTTLATAVFDKISGQFEGSYFSCCVREAEEKKDLEGLKRELYSKILEEEIVYTCTSIKERLSRKKVLIVLDDVSSFKQIEILIGDLNCFGKGSQIILTSRNREVLTNFCGLNDIYEVEELCFNDSLELFCQHVFKQNCPKVDYKELSKGVVEKIGGVPLVLRVLGSSLYGKGKEVWESLMEKLNKIFHTNIHEVLKISYDELDPGQQRIFLDIACFYKGWDVDLVKTIMETSHHISVAYDLSALEEKNLIIKLGNMLMMHDLVQAMGKAIVQQESIKSGERTRLWSHNDIHDVLTKAMGTETIEGISLDISNIRDIHLHPSAFANMYNLRFLRFYTSDYWRDNNKTMHVPEDLIFPLSELRYFQWQRCPLKSLHSNSYFENLVVLKLPGGDIEQLWSGVQQFDHLKEIDLGESKKLIRFPDLRAPKLERLSLSGCTSLTDMPLTFQHLTRLMDLSLVSCKNLTSVPQLPTSVQLFNLTSCYTLQRLPELPKNLERLELSGCSSLIEFPLSMQRLTRLNFLNIGWCESLRSISNCAGLISLQHLHLTRCSKLERLPEIPNNFKELDLFDCSSLFEISPSFKHLNKLERLNFRYCESLTNIPDLMGLTSLHYLNLSHCLKLKKLPEIPNNFEELDFFGCTSLLEIPSSFKHLNKLERLAFRGCKNLISIPDLRGLESLKILKIESCSNLKTVPKLPNSLGELYLKKILIEELPMSFEDLCTLRELDLIDCSRLKSLPSSFCSIWKSLKRLGLQNCPSIDKFPHPIACLRSLLKISISRCEGGILGSLLPPSIDFFQDLLHLRLTDCAVTKIPDSVGCLTSLETLELDRNNFERIPESIINLSNLRLLTIRHCERLKVLPKLPWTRIDAYNCTSLEEFSCPSSPKNIFALNRLRFVFAKFVNCFKLAQNSPDCFVKDAQRQFQAQSPSYHQVYEGKSPPLAICYPGSEILKWFYFQSSGSFIDVNLPLDWIDYNSLCFALCAVVSLSDQCKHNLLAKYECIVKSNKGGHKWGRMCGDLGKHFSSTDYSIGSSHVIIGFGFHFFRELHDNEFTFRFYISDERGSSIKYCKVEKCGVQMIFGKHVRKIKRK